MNIQTFKTQAAEDRELLLAHPLYSGIKEMAHVRIFMEHHVFAVWDFMSLLKSLQIKLTCTSIPWLPVGNSNTRYLINEIVTGEESDVNPAGGNISHFELYLEAMKNAGCDTSIIEHFIRMVREGKNIESALLASHAPLPASKFVNDTFEVINSNKDHILAAVFTFGREDLIPDMFLGMVKKLNAVSKDDKLGTFIYYLERHIEVDGGHHSLLAYEMTSSLCGNDEAKWAEALIAVKHAIRSRVSLWDGIYVQITQQ